MTAGFVNEATAINPVEVYEFPDDVELLSVTEYAKLTGLSARTVYTQIDNGIVQAFSYNGPLRIPVRRVPGVIAS